MDGLVAAGGYRDISDVISAAITNLAAIHREMKGQNAFVVPENPEWHSEAESRSKSKTVAEDDHGFEEYAKSRAVRPKPKSGQLAVPLLFRHPSTTDKLPRLAPLEAGARPRSVPVEDWIFGQYNRLLPAKAACRALANILARTDDHPPLTVVATKIADEAVRLGNYLADIDETRKTHRDDAVAVAFPQGNVHVLKAIERFANQFVGAINKAEKLSGLPAALKLIGPDPDHRDSALLTPAGWQFALLENPLLDGMSTVTPFDKFTPEEIAFLLEHIIANVSAEAFAFKTILDAIKKGAVTPSKLDSVLIDVFKPGIERSYLSTQRSGAVSRMTDLDLVIRKREGTRISYFCTPRGEALLSNLKKTSKAPVDLKRTHD